MSVQTIKDNHMKKSILTLMIASTFGISTASYRIDYPMENANGGSLENGSIVFKMTTTPVVPEVPVTPPVAKDECMPASAGVYAWRIQKTTGAGSVIWNGTSVGSIPAGASSINGMSGIVYRKDTASSPQAAGMFNLYGVCRNIPANFDGGTWTTATPTYTAWTDNGTYHDCTWSPDTSVMTKGQQFTQQGSDCQQDHVRTVQDREFNSALSEYRNVGSSYTETNSDLYNVGVTRVAIGTEVTSTPEDCINEANSSTTWSIDKTNNNNVNLITWKSAIISHDVNIGDVSSFTYNGVTYKRGAFLNNQTTGSQIYAESYGVCRVNN